MGSDKLRATVFLVVCSALTGCTLGSINAPKGSSTHVVASPTGAQSSFPTKVGMTSIMPGSFVMSLTWVSDTSGWVLAASPCGEGLCPQVARTGDGGITWERLPAPPASIQNAGVDCAHRACVSNIRFASPSVGYLFGPALLVTRDGGRTWVTQSGPPVEALEPGPGTVFRLVYDHAGCPGPCHGALQQAAVGSAEWRTVLRIGAYVSAQVIREGSRIYLPIYGNLASGAGDQHTVIFRSLDAGATWVRLEDPCDGSPSAVYDAIALAAAPGGSLAALCASRTQGDARFVLTSTDHGMSWRARHPVPRFAEMIAATSALDVVIANGPVGGNGPFTYRLAISTDGGLHWSTRITDREWIDPEAPYSAFLGFQDAGVARWVGYERAIWTTHDGGSHWNQQRFP